MNLLAASDAWIVDVIFFGSLALGLIIGIARGFVRSVAKLAGTIFSLIVAFFFCIQFAAFLESAFGWTTALANVIKSATLAYWLCVIISFILLTILTKLGVLLLAAIGKSLIDRSRALAAVDRVLGGVLGVIKALMILFLIMVIFKWIGIEALDAYMHESLIVGKIYFSGWPELITSLPGKFLQSWNSSAMLMR